MRTPRCTPLFLALSVLTPSIAHADDKESAVIFGAAQVKFRGTKDTRATSLKAEGGLDFNGNALDGGFTTSVFVKAPAQESSGSYRTRVDEFSSGWRGGLTLAYEWTDQSVRDYTADPCMVLLRRGASRAEVRAELEAQRDALAAVLAESAPSPPSFVPGVLTQDARQASLDRVAALAETESSDAERGLLQARLEHDAWARATNDRLRRDHEVALAAFEASRAQRAEQIESEISELEASDAAETAQIEAASRQLDARGEARGSDGNCQALPQGWKVRIIGSGELGGQTYAWRPLDADDPTQRARYSGAAQLSLDAVVTTRPDRTDRERTGWVFGPALTARYTQEWKSEDEVGVLDAALLDPLPTGEVRVDPRVVDAPTVAPTLSFRVYAYFAPPTPKRMFAFGPALAVTSVGEAQTSEGIHAPYGDKVVTRGELWFYFMPTDARTVNTRLGIGPFFDATVVGRTPQDPVVEAGALVSFQVGKPVYRY